MTFKLYFDDLLEINNDLSEIGEEIEEYLESLEQIKTNIDAYGKGKVFEWYYVKFLDKN